MTDKELLELAAKAAGIEIRPHVNARFSPHLKFTHDGENWNPLTDDGDALRLAVDLGIMVDPHHGLVCVRDTDIDMAPNDPIATRRAIVRAAAEIGKEK